MQPEDVMAQFEHGTTDSGMEVYSLYRPVPWVACTVIVHAGAIHDPNDLPGLAHLAEHCCKSTFKEDKLALIDWAKRFGGDFNPGVTNFQVTKYGFKLPLDAKILGTGFRILSEMLFGPAEKSVLTGERQRVLREWEEEAVSVAQKKFDDELEAKLLQGVPHRLGDTDGSPETIKRMTLESVRTFREKYYHPANMTLVCVGGLESRDIVPKLNAFHFGTEATGGTRNAKAPAMKGLIDPKTSLSQWSWKRLEKTKPSTTTYVHGMAYPISTPRFIPVCALDHLDGHFFRELSAKRGWIYGTKANIDQLPSVGLCAISMDADWKCADELRGQTIACIERAIADKAGIEDKMFIARQVHALRDACLSEYLDEAVGSLEVHHRVLTYKERWDVIENCTVKDVQDFLRRFLPPHSFAQQIVSK